MAPSKDLLRSPVRRRMLDLVHAEPGVTLSALVSRLGTGWGSAYLHLRALEEAGLVIVHQAGRRRLLLPAGARRPVGTGLLAGRSARLVAEAIAARPGSSVAEIARETGLSARSAYHHARRLVLAGLATARDTGGARALAPTEALRTLLAPGGRPAGPRP